MNYYPEDLYHKTVAEWRNMPMSNYICPATRARFFESESPRGYAGLMARFDSVDEDNRALIDRRLDSCSMCRLCQFKAMDDTSIPDAIAWFRGKRSSTTNSGSRLKNYSGRSDSFSVEEEQIGKGGALLVVSHLPRNTPVKQVAEDFAAAGTGIGTILWTPDLISLYRYGLWTDLADSLAKINETLQQYPEFLVPTSCDLYHFARIFGFSERQPKTFWQTAGLRSGSDSSKKIGRAIVVPAIPEALLKDGTAFSSFCRDRGYEFANGPNDAYTAEPKYFASLDDPLYNERFPEVAENWAWEIGQFADYLKADVVVFESLTAKEEFRRITKDFPAKSVFDLLQPDAEPGQQHGKSKKKS